MRKADAGFTLAETVIAMAMTLVIVGGALTALTTTTRLADTSRLMSDTNQNIQVGMSMMMRDFIQGGESVPLGGIPIPTGGGVLPIVRPGPIGSAFTFNTGPTLPAVTPGDGLGPTVVGVATDLVTVIYADPTLNLAAVPLDAIAADGSSMTVDVATPITGVNGIQVGDLILFTNALGSAIQMVTRLNGTQTVFFDAGDPMHFNQRGAPAGTILTLQSSPGVYPPTTATRMLMLSYFIDNVTAPTLPRLVRQVNNGAPNAVAMGIENLQFTFDLVDGVTNPSNLATIVAPNSPNQVRKANIYIMARSFETDHQTGQYFWNSAATSIALRSLSFVNKYE